MALRDQPYLPLYIQDFMTDEKLVECSAESTGVYIRVMCLMHKSESYGQILLKQKYKQSDKQTKNFAKQLARSMPYDLDTIERSLDELIQEEVITLDNGTISQKRMIKDNYISEVRKKAGTKGAEVKKDFAKAKPQANTEYEDEDESKDNTIPDFEKFKAYALHHEPNINIKELKYKYEAWKVDDWHAGKPRKKILNWKNTLLNTLKYIGTTEGDNYRHSNKLKV